MTRRLDDDGSVLLLTLGYALLALALGSAAAQAARAHDAAESCRASRAMSKLTLYSRPECHLCEALLADLEPLLRPGDSVETVDVDSEVVLERRYGLRIPVLVAGDIELSGYPLDRERVRRYLDSV